MKIFKYLRDDNAPINEIIFMTALSGLANALILAIINVSTDMVANNEIQSQYFILYIIVFLLYAYTQKYAMTRTIIAVEQFTNKVRLRIASKIRQVELAYIENTERGNIYTRLTQDSNLISQSTLLLISAAQSMMVLVFSFIYLIFISPISFFMTLVFLTIAILTYIYYESGIMRQLRITGQKEAKFFSYFSHLLDGFKEVRINRAKSDDLFQNIEKLSQETEDLRMDVGSRQVNTVMFARLSFYVLLAILVFIVPLFQASHAEEIYKISTTVLFIIGPIGLVISALPSAAKSNLALDNLYELEAELDKVIADKSFAQALVPFTDFSTLQLDKNTFAYRDAQGKASFGIGPIDLSIHKGELLFIVGGNGSGKSTLLKLLVGLYQPDEGHLLLDHALIEKAQYPRYRELFAIVFTDFHLFDKLYGVSHVDEHKVSSLLQMLGLEKKTRYQDGEFTQTSLSTGQRKRLAFLAAILEDKPIYIFDELAADQDPSFRRFFYESILPDLKRQGKTIIAVTHDDKYFHVADRVLKMEEGRLVEYRGEESI